MNLYVTVKIVDRNKKVAIETFVRDFESLDEIANALPGLNGEGWYKLVED